MELFRLMEQQGVDAPTMYMTFSTFLLRKYFTLSYQISKEHEFELSTTDDRSAPVILEAWKKGRKGVSKTQTLTPDEKEAIYRIFDKLKAEMQVWIAYFILL